MRSRILSMLAMSWMCVACGDSKDDSKEEQKPEAQKGPGSLKLDSFQKGSLANAEDAKRWALMGSAPNVYFASMAPSLLSMDLEGGEKDASCPVETEQGLTTKTVGNCTDKHGVEWLGSMEEVASLTGITTTYSGFGTVKTITCEGKTAKARTVFTGTVVMTANGTSAETASQGFNTNFVSETVAVDSDTCEETSLTAAIEYKGTLTGTPSTGSSESSGPSKWSGSGRIGNSKVGVISAETQDEVMDSKTCGTEAASGKTTLSSDGHRVEITYDGATDCADTSTVLWSLDGAAQGKLEGITCSAANGPTAAFWGVALFGAMGLLRRRARA
jgi:MYXO-CTERM domain-containing protein